MFEQMFLTVVAIFVELVLDPWTYSGLAWLVGVSLLITFGVKNFLDELNEIDKRDKR
jgi:hypothetical protein